MISIIVPLYNKEKCIKETLQSILNQTYTNFEIIVVNDGSTDASVDIVYQINDERIKIINQQNRGVASARNRGVNEAKGNWILFLDADDIIYPNCLSSLIILQKQYTNAEIYTANYDVLSTKKIKKQCSIKKTGYIDNPFKLIWNKQWNIRLGSFIMSKQCFYEINGFHQTMIIGEDTHFTKLLLINYRIAYTNESVMAYNQIDSSLSKKKVAFNKHIENYFLLPKNIFYLRMIEADMLFKHFFRGFIRNDIMFSINLIKKYWNKIPLLIYAELFKYKIINKHE